MNKKALVVVSFGTSYPETRKVTIEALEKQFEEEFQGWDIKRVFTSRIIKKAIKEKEGITVLNLEEMLLRLAEEGYDEVIVQSTHITRGAEYYNVYKTTKSFKDRFRSLKLGRALFYEHQDFVNTAKALETQFPPGAVVMMGHGNESHRAFNKTYMKLQSCFDRENKPVFIGLVEGVPGIDEVIENLKKAGVEKVTLMPLMIVAGDHARNDMAGDEPDSWKSRLEEAGIEVAVYLHGMGENRHIRALYIDHAKGALELVK